MRCFIFRISILWGRNNPVNGFFNPCLSYWKWICFVSIIQSVEQYGHQQTVNNRRCIANDCESHADTTHTWLLNGTSPHTIVTPFILSKKGSSEVKAVDTRHWLSLAFTSVSMCSRKLALPSLRFPVFLRIQIITLVCEDPLNSQAFPAAQLTFSLTLTERVRYLRVINDFH